MYEAKPPKLGTKRLCQECSAKFYDLGRQPIICPKCGIEHVVIVRLKSAPRTRGTRFESKATLPVEVVEAQDTADQPQSRDEDAETEDDTEHGTEIEIPDDDDPLADAGEIAKPPRIIAD